MRDIGNTKSQASLFNQVVDRCTYFEYNTSTNIKISHKSPNFMNILNDVFSMQIKIKNMNQSKYKHSSYPETFKEVINYEDNIDNVDKNFDNIEKQKMDNIPFVIDYYFDHRIHKTMRNISMNDNLELSESFKSVFMLNSKERLSCFTNNRNSNIQHSSINKYINSIL